MPKPIQLVLSLIFIAQMYVAMLVYGILYLPLMLFTRDGAHRAGHAYCRWVMLTARLLCGLRVEVRGTPPQDEALIAAKHQSFFDIMIIFSQVPRGKFIMKRELLFAPILGQYALKMGCIPVDRGKKGAAIAKMKEDVARGAAVPGQLIIYPQGTRVAPGAKRPYKVGTGLLYEQLGQPCVPVACNVGLFWPKHGLMRRRGTCVVEFLPPIPPGLPVPEFMSRMETAVETRSDLLMAEAGFGTAAQGH